MSLRMVPVLLALAAAPVLAEMAEPMQTPVDHATENRIVYPESARSDQVDDYHGVKVADPYRWLEDVDSEHTRAWVTAQNKVTSAYLAAIPDREELRALRRPLPARRTLFLHPQRWPAKSERPLSSRLPERRGPGRARSQRVVAGRHRGPLRHQRQRGRQAARLRPLFRRLGLAGVACARGGHRARSAGRAEVGEVLRRRLDSRQPGFFLQPL